jgi:hypothetical protein
MQNQVLSAKTGRNARRRVHSDNTPRISLNEHELAARWGMSVKTLRRWRQEQLGPVFCKLGARVIYLITDVEAFERRCSRYATGVPVSA